MKIARCELINVVKPGYFPSIKMLTFSIGAMSVYGNNTTVSEAGDWFWQYLTDNIIGKFPDIHDLEAPNGILLFKLCIFALKN